MAGPLSWTRPTDDGRIAEVRMTARADGDLQVDLGAEVLERRRQAIAPGEWTWLRQVHGAGTVRVTAPGEHAGVKADAAVTDRSGAVLVAHVADCAPVALVATNGWIGAIHAGWRGLEAEILARAVSAMRAHGARKLQAVLGSCIHPECYQFGHEDLQRLVSRFGPAVRGTTLAGDVALDVPALVRSELGRLEVPVVAQLGGCTACEATSHWSHRARAEVERQAMVVWMSPAAAPGERDR